MNDRRLIRVFISSPSDVVPERNKAEEVVRRLAREFEHFFRIEPVRWEREPLLASQPFQKQITPPHETEIAIVVLWSRLGVLLQEEQYRGPLSGRQVTGTEWEFEDALASYRRRELPDLLLYRKSARPRAEFSNRNDVEEQLQQIDLVNDFMSRWFRSTDGKSFTAASWSFEKTTDFELLLEEHLRNLLRTYLDKPPDAGTPVSITWHKGSPYRGLASFETEHAAVFYGRARARNELREALVGQIGRGRAFLLVTGASGSGKSSLVKAGLVPDLLQPGMVGRVAMCRYAITRPGGATQPTGDVLASLAACLFDSAALPELGEAPLEYSAESLRELLETAPSEATQPIRQGLSVAGHRAGLTEHGEARLILIVDQLEELFTTLWITDAARVRYAKVLAGLATSGVVWVVATLRSDFFDRLATLPELAALCRGDSTYLLGEPSAAEIGQMIRLPAREAGLRFETDNNGLTLDEVIGQAAAKNPGALPLLGYLLDQLWHHREQNGVLTYRAYRELQGLEGAIGERAEQILGSLSEPTRQAFPAVLRALVTVTGDEVVVATARAVPQANFGDATPRQDLVEALLRPDARILIADADDRNFANVRIAHEALLTHWERAKAQIAEDKSDLRTRTRLEDDAARWRAAAPGDQPGLLLPKGVRLSEAEDLVLRRRPELQPDFVAFVEASSNAVAEFARLAERRKLERAKRQATLRATAAVVTAFLILIFGAFWVALQFESDRGESRRLASETLDQLEVEPAMAIVTAREATKKARTPEAIFALRRALSEDHALHVLDNRLPIRFLRASADGQLLALASTDASGGSVVRLFKVAAPSRPIVEFAGPGTLESLALTADGKYLLAAGGSNPNNDHYAPQRTSTVSIVEVVTGRQVARLTLEENIHAAEFNPADDQRVVVAGSNCTSVVWNWRDDSKVVLKAPHCATAGQPQSNPGCTRSWTDRGLFADRAVFTATFSQSGHLVATGAGDCMVRVWDATTGTLEKEMPGHSAAVTSVSFQPLAGDRFLISASAGGEGKALDNAARLWDLESGTAKLLAVSNDYIYAMTFSPDGKKVVLGDGQNRAWVFDRETFNREALLGHRHWVGSATFSPDRHLVATASDLDVRVWDLAHGNPDHSVVFAPAGEGGSLTFGPDGLTLLTTRSGGRATLWSLGFLGTPLVAFDPSRDCNAALPGLQATSPNHMFNVVATGAQIRVLDNKKKSELTLDGHGQAVRSVRFNPDNTLLATAGGDDNTARIWDMATARERRTLKGHASSVISAEFDPSGSTILTASMDGDIRLWESATGRQIARVGLGAQRIEGACFKGDTIVSWGREAQSWAYPCLACGNEQELFARADQQIQNLGAIRP